MNRVLCLKNNRDVTIQQYAIMDDKARAQHRGHLVCIACGARARFRIVSAKRKPTFSARHYDGCVLTVKRWTAFRYLL